MARMPKLTSASISVKPLFRLLRENGLLMARLPAEVDDVRQKDVDCGVAGNPSALQKSPPEGFAVDEGDVRCGHVAPQFAPEIDRAVGDDRARDFDLVRNLDGDAPHGVVPVVAEEQQRRAGRLQAAYRELTDVFGVALLLPLDGKPDGVRLFLDQVDFHGIPGEEKSADAGAVPERNGPRGYVRRVQGRAAPDEHPVGVETAPVAAGISLHYDRGAAQFPRENVRPVENAALPREFAFEGVPAVFRVVCGSPETGKGVAHEDGVEEGVPARVVPVACAVAQPARFQGGAALDPRVSREGDGRLRGRQHEGRPRVGKRPGMVRKRPGRVVAIGVQSREGPVLDVTDGKIDVAVLGGVPQGIRTPRDLSRGYPVVGVAEGRFGFERGADVPVPARGFHAFALCHAVEGDDEVPDSEEEDYRQGQGVALLALGHGTYETASAATSAFVVRPAATFSAPSAASVFIPPATAAFRSSEFEAPLCTRSRRGSVSGIISKMPIRPL